MPYIKAHIVIQEEGQKLTIRKGGFYMNAENVYNIHEYDYNPVLNDGKPRTCVELTPHKNGDKRYVIFNKPLHEVEDLLLNSHSAARRSKHPRIKYTYNDMNNVMDLTLVTMSQDEYASRHDQYIKQKKTKELDTLLKILTDRKEKGRSARDLEIIQKVLQRKRGY